MMGPADFPCEFCSTLQLLSQHYQLQMGEKRLTLVVLLMLMAMGASLLIYLTRALRNMQYAHYK